MDTREQAKLYLLKHFKDKVKPDILEKNIEGLVDEYLEVQEFISKNGADVRTLPSKIDMKWWFQDPINKDELKSIPGDMVCEVKIDEIYLNEPHLAKPIFKDLFKWKWEYGVQLPDTVKELILLEQSIQNTKDAQKRKLAEIKLLNLALLGAIRFYNLERKPYMKMSEIQKINDHFKMVLGVIYKIDNGFYGKNKIKGSIYLFDAFGLKSNVYGKDDASTDTKESTPKKKYKRRKKVEDSNGGPISS